MKKVKIPVFWSVSGNVEIEIEDNQTLEDALQIAIDKKDELILPDQNEYIYDSIVIDTDMDLIQHINEE
jgi:hypothetical protein